MGIVYLSLTFDDGYLEHYEVAKILYKYDLVATFFVITGLKEYSGRKLLTSRPELVKDMHDMGHEIGSHTVTHRNLALLDEESIEWECRESKRVLEEIIGGRVLGLAYPYGSFNARVLSIVKNHYAYARGMGKLNRWNEDPDPYRVGSMGLRHVYKIPFKMLTGNVNLVVLAFHHEPLRLVECLARTIKELGFKIVSLSEALRRLGIIRAVPEASRLDS